MKKIILFIALPFSCFMHQAVAIDPVYEGENGIRAQVFLTNCLACHSSELTVENRNGAPTGADFDTYTTALSRGTAAVNRGVIQMNMPPSFSPLSLLNDEQKQALKNWQALGFPEKTLPTIYSINSAKLSLPTIYLEDEKGDITLKWKAEMTPLLNSAPLAFELTHIENVNTTNSSVTP
ncbi:MAG: hypothetical protein Q9M50_04280 [Methylococcales bacterium]|nr:hypothetical protein [Methylococcales bacterium]